MREHTKRHRTDDLVTIALTVRRSKVQELQRFAEKLQKEDDRSFSIAETFPEYAEKEPLVSLRAYRNREGYTQKELAQATGIPQHHISEMENGKRSIGKERAKRLAAALNCDYRQLL